MRCDNVLKSQRLKPIKVISSALIVAFFFQEVSFAAHDIKPIQWNPSPKPAIHFTIPASVGTIEDSYKGTDSKTLILVQDAHTNTSGQFNAARILDAIFSTDPVKYVFLEAGQGDESLSFLKKYAPQEKRQEVAKSFVINGKLQGTEYENLISDKDFVLWGVEDMALYAQSVESYRAVAKERDRLERYLGQVGETIESLKSKLYNPFLKTFDEKIQKYQKNEFSLTDYDDILLDSAKAFNVSLDSYSNLEKISHLKGLESAINFNKANEEENKAVQTLSPEDQKELLEAEHQASKLSAKDESSQKAFFLLLQEKLSNNLSKYPELSKYLNYLKASESINAKEVLKEQKSLEEAIYKTLIQNDDEASLVQASKNIGYLKKMFNLTLTPEEFEEYQKNKQSFDIERITGFLNKKIMDLKTDYERVAFLEQGYGDVMKRSEDFYKLTYQRNQKFIENSLKKMDEDHQSEAILVTGGYHTPNLKELLKQKNISYISITPNILQETNQKRYEELLLSGPSGQPAMPPVTINNAHLGVLGILYHALWADRFVKDETSDPQAELELKKRLKSLKELNGGMGIGVQWPWPQGGWWIEPAKPAVKEMVPEDPYAMAGARMATLKSLEAKTNPWSFADIVLFVQCAKEVVEEKTSHGAESILEYEVTGENTKLKIRVNDRGFYEITVNSNGHDVMGHGYYEVIFANEKSARSNIQYQNFQDIQTLLKLLKERSFQTLSSRAAQNRIARLAALRKETKELSKKIDVELHTVRSIRLKDKRYGLVRRYMAPLYGYKSYIPELQHVEIALMPLFKKYGRTTDEKLSIAYSALKKFSLLDDLESSVISDLRSTTSIDDILKNVINLMQKINEYRIEEGLKGSEDGARLAGSRPQIVGSRDVILKQLKDTLVFGGERYQSIVVLNAEIDLRDLREYAGQPAEGGLGAEQWETIAEKFIDMLKQVAAKFPGKAFDPVKGLPDGNYLLTKGFDLKKLKRTIVIESAPGIRSAIVSAEQTEAIRKILQTHANENVLGVLVVKGQSTGGGAHVLLIKQAGSYFAFEQSDWDLIERLQSVPPIEDGPLTPLALNDDSDFTIKMNLIPVVREEGVQAINYDGTKPLYSEWQAVSRSAESDAALTQKVQERIDRVLREGARLAANAVGSEEASPRSYTIHDMRIMDLITLGNLWARVIRRRGSGVTLLTQPANKSPRFRELYFDSTWTIAPDISVNAIPLEQDRIRLIIKAPRSLAISWPGRDTAGSGARLAAAPVIARAIELIARDQSAVAMKAEQGLYADYTKAYAYLSHAAISFYDGAGMKMSQSGIQLPRKLESQSAEAVARNLLLAGLSHFKAKDETDASIRKKFEALLNFTSFKKAINEDELMTVLRAGETASPATPIANPRPEIQVDRALAQTIISQYAKSDSLDEVWRLLSDRLNAVFEASDRDRQKTLLENLLNVFGNVATFYMSRHPAQGLADRRVGVVAAQLLGAALIRYLNSPKAFGGREGDVAMKDVVLEAVEGMSPDKLVDRVRGLREGMKREEIARVDAGADAIKAFQTYIEAADVSKIAAQALSRQAERHGKSALGAAAAESLLIGSSQGVAGLLGVSGTQTGAKLLLGGPQAGHSGAAAEAREEVFDILLPMEGPGAVYKLGGDVLIGEIVEAIRKADSFDALSRDFFESAPTIAYDMGRAYERQNEKTERGLDEMSEWLRYLFYLAGRPRVSAAWEKIWSAEKLQNLSKNVSPQEAAAVRSVYLTAIILTAYKKKNPEAGRVFTQRLNEMDKQKGLVVFGAIGRIMTTLTNLSQASAQLTEAARAERAANTQASFKKNREERERQLRRERGEGVAVPAKQSISAPAAAAEEVKPTETPSLQNFIDRMLALNLDENTRLILDSNQEGARRMLVDIIAGRGADDAAYSRWFNRILIYTHPDTRETNAEALKSPVPIESRREALKIIFETLKPLENFQKSGRGWLPKASGRPGLGDCLFEAQQLLGGYAQPLTREEKLERRVAELEIAVQQLRTRLETDLAAILERLRKLEEKSGARLAEEAKSEERGASEAVRMASSGSESNPQKAATSPSAARLAANSQEILKRWRHWNLIKDVRPERLDELWEHPELLGNMIKQPKSRVAFLTSDLKSFIAKNKKAQLSSLADSPAFIYEHHLVGASQNYVERNVLPQLDERIAREDFGNRRIAYFLEQGMAPALIPRGRGEFVWDEIAQRVGIPLNQFRSWLSSGKPEGVEQTLREYYRKEKPIVAKRLASVPIDYAGPVYAQWLRSYARSRGTVEMFYEDCDLDASVNQLRSEYFLFLAKSQLFRGGDQTLALEELWRSSIFLLQASKERDEALAKQLQFHKKHYPDDYIIVNRGFGHQENMEKELSALGMSSSTLFAEPITQKSIHNDLHRLMATFPNYSFGQEIPDSVRTALIKSFISKSLAYYDPQADVSDVYYSALSALSPEQCAYWWDQMMPRYRQNLSELGKKTYDWLYSGARLADQKPATSPSVASRQEEDRKSSGARLASASISSGELDSLINKMLSHARIRLEDKISRQIQPYYAVNKNNADLPVTLRMTSSSGSQYFFLGEVHDHRDSLNQTEWFLKSYAESIRKNPENWLFLNEGRYDIETPLTLLSNDSQLSGYDSPTEILHGIATLLGAPSVDPELHLSQPRAFSKLVKMVHETHPAMSRLDILSALLVITVVARYQLNYDDENVKRTIYAQTKDLYPSLEKEDFDRSIGNILKARSSGSKSPVETAVWQCLLQASTQVDDSDVAFFAGLRKKYPSAKNIVFHGGKHHLDQIKTIIGRFEALSGNELESIEYSPALTVSEQETNRPIEPVENIVTWDGIPGFQSVTFVRAGKSDEIIKSMEPLDPRLAGKLPLNISNFKNHSRLVAKLFASSSRIHELRSAAEEGGLIAKFAAGWQVPGLSSQFKKDFDAYIDALARYAEQAKGSGARLAKRTPASEPGDRDVLEYLWKAESAGDIDGVSLNRLQRVMPGLENVSIARLFALGYIQKLPNGLYALTSLGQKAAEGKLPQANPAKSPYGGKNPLTVRTPSASSISAMESKRTGGQSRAGRETGAGARLAEKNIPKKLQNILNKRPHAVWYTGYFRTKETVLYANEAFAKAFGKTVDQVLKEATYKAINPAGAPIQQYKSEDRTAIDEGIFLSRGGKPVITVVKIRYPGGVIGMFAPAKSSAPVSVDSLEPELARTLRRIRVETFRAELKSAGPIQRGALVRNIYELSLQPDRIKDITPLMPDLIKLLSEKFQISIADNARKSLENIGTAAVPSLIRRLRNEDELVRKYAIMALGNIRPVVIEAIPLLVALLNDRDGMIKGVAAQALEKMLIPYDKSDAAVIAAFQKEKENLAPFRKDPNLNVQRPIARILAHLPGGEVSSAPNEPKRAPRTPRPRVIALQEPNQWIPIQPAKFELPKPKYETPKQQIEALFRQAADDIIAGRLKTAESSLDKAKRLLDEHTTTLPDHDPLEKRLVNLTRRLEEVRSGARLASLSEDQAVSFLVNVFNAQHRSGRVIVGLDAFEVRFGEDKELVIVGFGKELLRTKDWRSVSPAPGVKADAFLSLADFETLLQNAFLAVDAIKINPALNDKKALLTINLDGLNPKMKGFSEVTLPLLIRELEYAHQHPYGKQAKFLLSGNADALALAAASLAGYFKEGQDYIFLDAKQVPDEYVLHQADVTDPLHPLKGRNFYVSTPKEGDILNFRGAVKISLGLARLDNLDTANPDFIEIKNAVAILLGHPIRNVSDFIGAIEALSAHPDLYAAPALATIPMSAYLQAARLAMKMTLQAA